MQYPSTKYLSPFPSKPFPNPSNNSTDPYFVNSPFEDETKPVFYASKLYSIFHEIRTGLHIVFESNNHNLKIYPKVTKLIIRKYREEYNVDFQHHFPNLIEFSISYSKNPGNVNVPKTVKVLNIQVPKIQIPYKVISENYDVVEVLNTNGSCIDTEFTNLKSLRCYSWDEIPENLQELVIYQPKSARFLEYYDENIISLGMINSKDSLVERMYDKVRRLEVRSHNDDKEIEFSKFTSLETLVIVVNNDGFDLKVPDTVKYLKLVGKNNVIHQCRVNLINGANLEILEVDPLIFIDGMLPGNLKELKCDYPVYIPESVKKLELRLLSRYNVVLHEGLESLKIIDKYHRDSSVKIPESLRMLNVYDYVGRYDLVSGLKYLKQKRVDIRYMLENLEVLVVGCLDKFKCRYVPNLKRLSYRKYRFGRIDLPERIENVDMAGIIGKDDMLGREEFTVSFRVNGDDDNDGRGDFRLRSGMVVELE